MAEKSEFKQRSIPALMMQSVAIVAALFTLVISVLLISDYARLQQMDPLNDRVLLELRQELADSSGDNEALVEQIRTYDLYARRAFFSSAEQRHLGGWMLLGGAVACFVAFRFARFFLPEKPTVGAHESVSHKEMNALFRQMMAATGVLITVVALFLAFGVKSDLATVLAAVPSEVGAAPASTAAAVPVGLPESFFANWPSLRGPGNVGIAGSGEFPVQWDVESGEGVRWSVAVPVMGFNSPIVWEGRVFMSGADEEGMEVMCFDMESGELLWTRSVESSIDLPNVSVDTGYAAPTMTTDGERVFAIFANGELVAFDMNGNPAWQKNIGCPENPYGMGSSLLSDGERIFIQYDHENEKKVMALNGKTGDLIWETPRTHVSWSSPALIKVNDQWQLILNDNPFVTAYDPVSGKQLWQVECLGGEVAPSPAFNGKDILFVGNEYAQATALRLTDGAPEVLWQYSDYLPEIASPLATAERIYIPTTAGDIVCLNAESGEELWVQEFDDGFNASLICAGNRICAVDLSGVVHIFDDADVYHAVADLPLNDKVYATPALVNNQLIVRGDYNLYCLGSGE